MYLLGPEGDQHCAGECWADPLHGAEGGDGRLQVIPLLQGPEGLLGVVHHHPGGVHLDEVLELLTVLAHGQLPLHALHNLLVGQVSILQQNRTCEQNTCVQV